MSTLLQFIAQVGSRNRRKRHDVYGTPRAQANRQLSDGRVVGGFDGSDKIIRAEHSVLSNHFTAEVRDLLVHELEPVRMIKQCLTSFGRQSTQQNVRGHDCALRQKSASLPVNPLAEDFPFLPSIQAARKYRTACLCTVPARSGAVPIREQS